LQPFGTHLGTLGLGLLLVSALAPSAAALYVDPDPGRLPVAVSEQGLNCESSTTKHTDTEYDHHTTCLVHFGPDGTPDCIGWVDSWENDFNDPNNPPSTDHWTDCSVPLP
jgi:hypothetical protein